MRLIDVENSKLQTQLKIIREAEYQIYGSGSWGFTAKCEHAIEDAPTVQPEPHWIPVTKATPTEDDDYWCTFDAETGRFVDWCSWYQGRWVVWTDNTVSEVSNVIAWCKPIEPYKGVTDGND